MTTFNNHAVVHNQTGIQNIHGAQYNGPVHIVNSTYSQSQPTGNVHWTVPRVVNSLFSGREQILKRIEQAFRARLAEEDADEPCRVVITGLGGQGKSEICLRIANIVRQCFWAVFWVDVSTTDQAKAGFLNIAARLQQAAETVDQAREILANQSHPWLLILDNADDLNVDYSNYLPSGSSGCVLMTSRNFECGDYATSRHEELDGLDDTAARSLLLKAARIPLQTSDVHEADARAVCELLGSHPLALIQAGAYVAQRQCTLAQYPQVYKEQHRRLLAFRPTQARSRYQDVYATFEASAAVLHASPDKAAKDALEILSVLSMRTFSALPVMIFRAAWKHTKHISPLESDEKDLWQLLQWHADQLISPIRTHSRQWDPSRLMCALHLLKSLALVFDQGESDNARIYMHPLTHAWAKDRQTQQKQVQSWITAGCIFAISSREKKLWSSRPQTLLRPHLLALIDNRDHDLLLGGPQAMVVRIWVRCIYLLTSFGLNQRPIRLLESLLAELGLDPGDPSDKWRSLYELLGTSLRISGEYQRAIALQLKTVDMCQRTLMEDDPGRLYSEHSLAEMFVFTAQTKQAIKLCENVVEIQSKILPEDHPNQLASQHELASAYLEDGRVQDAIKLLEYVVEIQNKILPEDHPDRLPPQHELSRALWEDGQYDKAISLMTVVVRIRQRILKPGQPCRVESEDGLEYWHRELDRMAHKSTRSQASKNTRFTSNIRKKHDHGGYQGPLTRAAKKRARG